MRVAAALLGMLAAASAATGDTVVSTLANKGVKVALTSPSLVVFRVHGLVGDCQVRMLNDFRRRARGAADVIVLYDPSIGLGAVTEEAVRKGRDALAKQLHPVPVLSFGADAVVGLFPRVRWPLPCLHWNITPQAASRPASEHLCRLPTKQNGTKLSQRDIRTRSGWHRHWASEMKRRFSKKGQKWDIRQVVSYVLHEPQVVLMLRHLETMKESGKLQHLPNRVWVIEHDAAFGGDLQAFLRRYESDKTDLVTVLAHSVRKTPVTTQFLSGRYPFHTNAEFIKRFPTPYFKWEHVDGYTVPFLRRLGGLLDAGAAATGEFLAITVCRHTPGCTVRDLTADKYVAQSQRCFADSIPCPASILNACGTPTEAQQQRCGREFAAFKGKWLHKVKDWCAVPYFKPAV